MRLSMKITCIFLTFVLLTSCEAATENKDLPTKEEITDFIAGIPVSDNYINTVFNTVIDKQPTWKCDIWEDKNGNQLLSLYYVDPGSAKGYGSIYFNEFGKEISTGGVEIVPVPVKNYVGKAVSEETIDNTVQIADETVQTGHEAAQTDDGNVQTGDGNILITDKNENKDLPTKKEITDFIASIPVTDNYINTVYDAVIDKHPIWKCDIWEDINGNQLLSLYYVDPGSTKGYGSIYFNEFGKEISNPGVGFKLKNHYVRKADSEETNSVKTTPAKTTLVKTTTSSTEEQLPEEEAQLTEEKTQTVGNEQLAEYEKRLAEYEKRLAEYEEKQSVGYKQQIINTVQSIDGKDQSAEYKELLDEYKELLEEYKKIQEVDVTPPTEPEETKWYKEAYPEIFGGLVVAYATYKLRWNK